MEQQNIELTLAQAQILSDKHRFRVVNIGRRGGKTTVAIEEIKCLAFFRPNSRICYIAPTYQQARDIAWEQLKRELRGVATSINESRLEIRIICEDKVSESIILLRGWESVETLRGQGFDFLVLDEVAMMRNFWENWHEVLRPTLSDRKGQALFISTPKGYNHFYDLYQLYKTDNDFKSFHFTTYDNPYIPTGEIDKARTELPDDQFAQEYLADFRKVQGLVYKEFSREIHVTDVIPQYRTERILGIDFGYTNPTAVLVIDVDNLGNYWIVEEWYRTGKTNIEVIEYAKSKLTNAVYPDPAEPDRIEEMRRHGLNAREVSKEISAGVTKVRELFKANKIKIHKSCVNLIQELETYSYPNKKDEKNYDEVPIKENDHAVDSLRYALFMHVGGDMARHIATQYRPKYKVNML